MIEVELKLQVPPGALAAVAAEVGTGAPSQRLQAFYFDTAERHLAAAGLALRLRKEGRRWLQTLKSGAAHAMQRGEHNAAVAAVPGLAVPPLDLSRHAGTAVGAALDAVLAKAGGSPLRVQYRTDVRRRSRTLRSRRGSVELALDVGHIEANPPGADQPLRWPVCELEVELLGGSPLAVIDVARRLARRHDLWLDTRSKAERGDRLARGLAADAPVAAVRASPLELRAAPAAPPSAPQSRAKQGSLSPDKTARHSKAEPTAAAARRAVLHNVLAHALPTGSEVAAGQASPESLHQLRVALRRLRSAERLFEGMPGLAPAERSEPAAALFRALGASRDRDALAGGLQADVDAALACLGEAPLALGALPEAAPWSDRERASLGLVWFDLLAESLAEPGPEERPGAAGAAEAEAPEFAQALAERLGRWHGQVRRDAKRFLLLDDTARHRLRKRLKRLRYGVEFAASLFKKRAVSRYLERLRAAQEKLGEYNDLAVAQSAYASAATAARAAGADGEPRAWFALGWLAERRTRLLEECAAELLRFREAKAFWRT